MTSLPSRNVPDTAADPGVRRLQSFGDLMLSVWERWIALNLDATRSVYASASVTARSLIDETVRTQVAAYEECGDLVTEYVRNVNYLCANTQATMARINADTMIESTGSMPTFLQQVGAPGPHAAYDVITLLQSAVSNSGAICERMIQTGRDMADSNFAVAAQAFQSVRPAPTRPARSSRKVA